MIPIAFVESRTGGVVKTWLADWEKLSNRLARCDIGEKDGRGWMPADIEPGQRTAERVKSISLLVLDVEAKAENVEGTKKIIGPEPPVPDAMSAELGLWGWRCILHTSYNHMAEHPRYRLTFDLSRPLAPEEIKPLGLHVAALLGIGDCIDTGCLEPARLFYLPRCPADRKDLFHHADTQGNALLVDELIAEATRINEAKKSATATRRTGQSASVIEAFNNAHDVGLILEQHGYKPLGRRRWLWAGSTTGLAGVRLLPDAVPQRVYSSHGGDPLNDGHGHDAFDLWRILRHGADMSAAVKDAARICGMATRTASPASASAPAMPAHQPDAGNAPAGDPASPELLTPKPGGALSETDVTHVTDVQANNGAACSVTADPAVDVTGVTPEPIIPDEGKRPCFKVYDDWQPLPEGGKLKPGVWLFTVKHGKNDAPSALIQQWICSPLHVEAVTLDEQENNFGRLLRFKTTTGKWREWAMPMDTLAGDGVIMRAELLSMGAEIDPQAGRSLLAQYLQAKPPKRRIRCALQVGWCGDSFVLPDTVIGPKASSVIFQSGERAHDEHTRGGTLAGWQSDIAARAVGNPLLTLALSVSFAGPMLGRCNGESGGIHLVGDSATGKTTAIEAACATWGGANFRRSWRATANGMEGAAALFNDCLLALDEISECDPREVGAIVYALGNGRGKQRASRTGNARGVTRWRVVVLSSGERTIGTTMAEGGYRIKAGQSMRLLDIPAARRFGAWDELHGLPNGAAFADVIRRAAVAHHGHAGRAFLEKLTRDDRDFCATLDRIKALPDFSANDGEGQEKRTAARFALLALAGEVATEYGITGWPEGAAIEAAAEGFNAWRLTRGRGNDERRQILERVSGFIERHGDSRFSNADANTSDDAMRINRAGWWRGDGNERVYLFNAEGLREALKGFDFKRALDTLQETGALPKADGERAKAQRIGGRPVRLYPIQADKLGGDHGA